MSEGLHIRATPHLILGNRETGLPKRLLYIGDEVLHILDTHREADEVGSYAGLAQLLVGELAVSVTGGVEHT